MEPTVRRLYPVVLAAAALLLVAKIGSYPLLDPDEARFARTSVEMLRSGDWVVPAFEGAPRLAKPPLLHWLQAWLFRLLGPSEAPARLPAVLATLVSILIVGWLARRRFGEEGRVWATAIFATMPLVLVVGRIGTLDALLAAHVVAAVALDMIAPDGGAQRGAAIGALLGLAFLIKGPVGVATALVVMLAGRTASGRDVLPSIRTAVAGVTAWCVVVLPWGLAFLERIGASGVRSLLHDEVVRRAVEGTAHVEPPWYYAPVVAIGCLPWAGPLVVGLFRSLQSRREPGAQTALYSSGGFIAGLAMFSLFRGKLPNYILPLMPLAALVVTWELGQELGAPRRRRLGQSLLLATLVAMSVAFAGAAALRLEAEARGVAVAGAFFFAAAAATGIVAFVQGRPRLLYGAAAAATALFLFGVVLGVTDLLGERRSAATVVASVPALAEPRPVVVVGRRLPSLTWYLDRVPEVLSSHEEIVERLAKADGALFVVQSEDLKLLPREALSALRTVGRGGDYVVLEATSSSRK